MSEAFDLATALSAIPMSRWIKARRALDMTADELLGDQFAQLIMAANEKGRQANGGRDDFPRFLAMGMAELTEFLGLSDDDEVDDDSKSDAAA